MPTLGNLQRGDLREVCEDEASKFTLRLAGAYDKGVNRWRNA